MPSFCLSLSLSLSLSLWLYRLLDFGQFFSFLILYTDARTPWTRDQPVARPLPTHRSTQTQNKHTHRQPCFEWDSNPRSKCLSGRRQLMCVCAATVMGSSFCMHPQSSHQCKPTYTCYFITNTIRDTSRITCEFIRYYSEKYQSYYL
jgi:hypothetical protein